MKVARGPGAGTKPGPGLRAVPARATAAPWRWRPPTGLPGVAGCGRQADVAAELGVTPGRITQLKRELAKLLAEGAYEPPLGPRPGPRKGRTRLVRHRGERSRADTAAEAKTVATVAGHAGAGHRRVLDVSPPRLDCRPSLILG